MKIEILFSLMFFCIFSFISQKQSYASRNFTGSSVVVQRFIRLAFIVSLLFSIYYLIVLGIKVNWIIPVVIIPVSLIINIQLNRILIRLTLGRKYKFNQNQVKEDLWLLFNRRQDIVSTICAELGFVISPILALLMIKLI